MLNFSLVVGLFVSCAKKSRDLREDGTGLHLSDYATRELTARMQLNRRTVFQTSQGC